MPRLETGQLLRVCDPAALPFTTTADLTPLDAIIGQERAVSPMEAGIGIRDAGYHIFVPGPAATRKTTMMQRLLATVAAPQPTAAEHCYVHNFADPGHVQRDRRRGPRPARRALATPPHTSTLGRRGYGWE